MSDVPVITESDTVLPGPLKIY